MEAAEQLVEPHGILLTTDADGKLDCNWIALNLQALARGADAVAGRVEIDPLDAALIPPKLHEDDARECFYGELLDRISAELDPDPFDRLPRHSEHSGASIAVSVSAYRCAGRIPAIPMGEDRAFFAALRRIDARIRHAPEVRVIVSGRTIGRAVGGMADTIRRRLIKADDTADDQFEPALPAARRAQLRRLARVVWSNPVESEVDLLAKQLLISPSKVKRALATPYFGAAWSELESNSTMLARRKVLITDLDSQTKQAQMILDLYARCARPKTPPGRWGQKIRSMLRGLMHVSTVQTAAGPHTTQPEDRQHNRRPSSQRRIFIGLFCIQCHQGGTRKNLRAT